MMMWRTGFLSCLLTAGVWAQPAVDRAKSDLQRMQGLWKVEKAVMAGSEAPEEIRSKLQLKVEGNTFTILEEGNAREERAEVTLDPNHSPRQINIKPRREGADPRQGIYHIEGDTMKLCWAFEGGRPKEFASEAGTKTRLFILKRAK